MEGLACLHQGRQIGIACLTHWLLQSDVAGKLEHVLRVGMPVSSLCKALIYDQRLQDNHSGLLQLYQICNNGDIGKVYGLTFNLASINLFQSSGDFDLIAITYN